MGTRGIGIALATLTAVTWGGQFVVAKSAVARVDAFHLTTLRYGVAALVLLGLLAALEGPRALRPGRGLLRLTWLGALGFAGFNVFVYTGLEHASAASASLVSATGPLLTALVLWARTRVAPRRSTVAALAAALVGIALVVSHGRPEALLHGAFGWADALVVAGVLSFVLYTLGAARFPQLSPLRYTALTAAYGWLTVAGATVLVTATGLEPEPSSAAVRAVVPQLAYISLLGAVVAVLSWNLAVGRIGAQDTALIGNLVPVTTFAIEVVRGYRPGGVELGGAVLTVGALVAANVAARLRGDREPVARRVDECGDELTELLA